MPISIVPIKKLLDPHVGGNLTVVTQAGRKKVTKGKGTLRSTFPTVSVVDPDQNQNSFERVPYSYTDLLTKNIELKLE